MEVHVGNAHTRALLAPPGTTPLQSSLQIRLYTPHCTHPAAHNLQHTMCSTGCTHPPAHTRLHSNTLPATHTLQHRLHAPLPAVTTQHPEAASHHQQKEGALQHPPAAAPETPAADLRYAGGPACWRRIGCSCRCSRCCCCCLR
eukprot:1139852-Pelagomonas_calceolata.AAC.9